MSTRPPSALASPTRVSPILAMVAFTLGCQGTVGGGPTPDAAPSDGLTADGLTADGLTADGLTADGPVVDGPAPSANPLAKVRFWAYQIQSLNEQGAVDALVASKYDLLVLEPTRTDRSTKDFDTKGMVTRLHTTKGLSGDKRLVLAYIDIGEAESWRDYWQPDWQEPTEDSRGKPDFLIAPDPDGWADNYPVAYWDKRWKAIMIHNADSALNKVLDDGFDGIYMDWVEAYVDESVRAAAQQAGVDPAQEMVTFIREIRDHARKRNPEFLVVPQNVPELATEIPEYLEIADGIAQEQIYYDGEADTSWGSPAACDQKLDTELTDSIEANLAVWLKAGLPVLNVEYACSPKKVADSYARSAAKGYVTYVSRRPLDRLTSDPPPGYN